MGNPRLLLLDEPSEGLAPIVVKMLAEHILRLKEEGVAILLSEQNLLSRGAYVTGPICWRREASSTKGECPIWQTIRDFLAGT